MEKLTITGYEKQELTGVIATFEAPINPASISLSFSTKYNKGESPGTVTPEMKFAGGEPPKLSFELIIDGTRFTDNISPTQGGGMTTVDVNTKLEEFKNSCYYYISGKHETPYVSITWGKSLLKQKKTDFAGRIENFSVNYTLFDKDGKPLRAKISASFIGTLDPATDSKQKSNSSPDLTHLITINAGDSLPTLCNNIYGDPQMCHQVAKVNKIVNFRKIKPGQVLEFPPMK